LRCEDRCGMWHSVESRTPFADDTALIEKSFKIPENYKIKNGTSKYILRESMKNYLPASVYNRKDKMGFVTPHNKWLPVLLKNYPKMAENRLLQRFMNPQFFIRLNQLSAKSNHLQSSSEKKEENMAFKTLVFSLWAKKNGF
jgi:asparagine synthetase B (glutamine-hydrolysing)